MESLPALKRAFSLKRNLTSLFVRPSHNMAPIDGLRALAILLVVACHLLVFCQLFLPDAAEQFNALPIGVRWLSGGGIGVDLFFVLSGFLIGGILFQEYQSTDTLNIKRFFVRRFMRLMPVYWLTMAFAAGSILLPSQPKHMIMELLPPNLHNIWSNLLYVNNFIPFEEQVLGLTHSWSLAVEEQFYFVFPFLLLAFFRFKLHRHPIKTIIGALLVYWGLRGVCMGYAVTQMVEQCGVAFDEIKIEPMSIFKPGRTRCQYAYFFDGVYSNLYTKFIALFFGVVASYLKVFRLEAVKAFFANPLKANVGGCAALVAIGFTFFAESILGESLAFSFYYLFYYQLVFSLGVAFLILFALYAEGGLGSVVRRCLSLRVFYPVAQLSYSIYLFHVFFIMVTYDFMIEQGFSPSLVEMVMGGIPGIIAGTALVCTGSYLFLEKPIMNLRDPAKSVTHRP
jgi:peptidoglycan/LPS O-acetylase OafA/YrhL